MSRVAELRAKVREHKPQYNLRDKMSDRWTSTPRWARVALMFVFIVENSSSKE